MIVSRFEQILGGEHQFAGFLYGFLRKRHMDSHLVTIEVSVEGRTNQRMQLDGRTLDQDRFKGLDPQTV